MNTEMERAFFGVFEWGGVVDWCLQWMREKYDLGFLPHKDGRKLPENGEKYYDEILPRKIREATDVFDRTSDADRFRQLMDEIGSNLDDCQNEAQRERYLFSLLKPFKGLSDVYHPTAEVNRLQVSIEKYKREKAMWEGLPEERPLFTTTGSPAGTPKKQIEACEGMADDYQKAIDRLYYINGRFCEIIGGQTNEKDSVEWCLGGFVRAAGMFANRLDALLLERTEFKPEHRESKTQDHEDE